MLSRQLPVLFDSLLLTSSTHLSDLLWHFARVLSLNEKVLAFCNPLFQSGCFLLTAQASLQNKYPILNPELLTFARRMLCFGYHVVLFSTSLALISFLNGLILSQLHFMRDALRDLVPFMQFKKREKHPWRSVSFSNVAGNLPANCLSVFERFVGLALKGLKS